MGSRARKLNGGWGSREACSPAQERSTRRAASALDPLDALPAAQRTRRPLPSPLSGQRLRARRDFGARCDVHALCRAERCLPVTLSQTPRFQPPRCDRELQYRLSGMGFIDPDVGHKATLATSVARSRQRLSYAFRSRKQRFASHSHEDGPGPTRAAEEHGSIFARIRASKLTYTGMTDKASPRFSERPASHEAYKQTCARRAQSARGGCRLALLTCHTCGWFSRAIGGPRSLGPGAYGVPHDEAVRPRTAGVPRSKSPRFKEARDPFKYIGSTYTHARCESPLFAHGSATQPPRPLTRLPTRTGTLGRGRRAASTLLARSASPWGTPTSTTCPTTWTRWARPRLPQRLAATRNGTPTPFARLCRGV